MQRLTPGTSSSGLKAAVLVPRWTDRGEAETQGTPFRVLLLVGAMMARGVEVVFFDQEHDEHRNDRWGEYSAAVQTVDAAFVWLNELYPSNQCHNSFALAERLRSVRADLPIVLGGEFVSICPPEFFDFDQPFDFVLQGYGDESTLDLLEALTGSKPLKNVPGLMRRAEGGWISQPRATRAPKLDDAMAAIYEHIDMRPYIQTGGVFGNDQPTLTLALGRGCTKGCDFCAWSNHPASLLQAGTIFRTFEILFEKYGVRQFHIGELDFFVSRSRALRLAELIENSTLDIVWFALGSPIDLARFSDDDWDALRDGGLRKVEMGSESASSRLLPLIGKSHDPEDIYRISCKMLDRGIVPMNNFLFGFPDECDDDRLANLRMIDRLAEVSTTGNHFTYRYYQPTWDTPLGKRAIAQVPNAPTRLDAWLATRDDFIDEKRRTLPWLSPRDERIVKQLINHDLPLATSRIPIESRVRDRVYRELRSRARQRLRSGSMSTPVERWMFDRFVRRPLDQTYVR
ncbi:MAG: radical SAM protein [Planctomycetes bacterium]|nr:radical SAM protein [Planctomycetota bacterium]